MMEIHKGIWILNVPRGEKGGPQEKDATPETSVKKSDGIHIIYILFVYIYIYFNLYIPASFQGCCLNPKECCIGTPHHPFSKCWKRQVYTL